MVTLRSTGVPSNEYAFFNRIYLSRNIFEILLNQTNLSKGASSMDVKIKNFIIRAEPLLEGHSIDDEHFGVSGPYRDMLNISKLEDVEIEPANVRKDKLLSHVDMIVDVLNVPNSRNNQVFDMKESHLEKLLRNKNSDLIFNKHQIFLIKDEHYIMKYTVTGIQFVGGSEEDKKKRAGRYGFVENETEINFKTTPAASKFIKIKSDKLKEKEIFKKDFNFQKMGIGGLDKEFEEIFRRAFNSRRYPQIVLDKYGIKHVKGMLLYGPPGTGKTLIARQIAQALDCDEPKLINGPEIFDKYVGGSEEKMREVFKEAEDDMKQNGDESNLHIIIFDEIDAVCRPRGSVSSGTGVHESVVNQFLAKLDGVESLNNILVIGMTNRKDMIDEAVLRPGRLEIHKEIGLPDFKGRLQIFEIHTRSIRENKLLSKEVDFDYLSEQTKNYTGAEIESVCRNAVNYTLFRDIDVNNIGKLDLKDIMNRKVTMEDFKLSLEEIKPQFGMDQAGLENRLSGGFIHYSENFNKLYDHCQTFIENLKQSETNSLMTVLLSGDRGTGKTAFATKVAIESGFPFVKMITPEDFVGYSEAGKRDKIVKIFDDAYKSPLSLIVLDDIERLIEFIHIGPRFSNHLLQALLVLIKKKPSNPERKLFILGTTSIKDILEQLDVVDWFNANIKLPLVSTPSEIKEVVSSVSNDGVVSEEISESCPKIAIKDLILITEMAKQEGKGKLNKDVFMECLNATR